MVLVVLIALFAFLGLASMYVFYSIMPKDTRVLNTLASNRLRIKFAEIEPPASKGEELFRNITKILDEEGYSKNIEKAVRELGNVFASEEEATKQFLGVEGALILLVKLVGVNGFQLSKLRRTEKNYKNLDTVIHALRTLTNTPEGLDALVNTNEALYDIYVSLSYGQTSSRIVSLSILTDALLHSEKAYTAILQSAEDYMYIPGDEEYLFAHLIAPLIADPHTSDVEDIQYHNAILKFLEGLLCSQYGGNLSKMVRKHFNIVELSHKLQPLSESSVVSTYKSVVSSLETGDEIEPNFHTTPFERRTCYCHQFSSRVRWFSRIMNCLFNCLPATLPIGQGVMQYFSDEFRKKSDERMNELKNLKRSGDFTPEEISKFNREMSALTLGVGVDFFDHMKESGMFAETRLFIDRAESVEHWNHEELLQAGRNVWTCFGLQMILYQQNVTMSDAYLGYSLLYPYTDNYLDDDTITPADKKIFQDLFTRRLAGEPVEPRSDAESKIWNCVKLIENRFNRKEFPNAFNSLIAINEAQTKSLKQHGKEIPSEELIMEISMEKGGTSVLADGYLVNGDMTEEDALFAFGLGVALQLVDDLQDTSRDIAVNQHTLFTLPFSNKRPANSRACRLIQLMQIMVDPSHYADVDDDGKKLRTAMLKMTNTIALKAVAKYCYLFTEDFVEEVGRCSPIPLNNLSRVNNMARMLQMVRSNQI